MKPVHPQTWRAIIREYERNQRVRVLCSGHVVKNCSIEVLRALHLFNTGHRANDIIISLDGLWRKQR
jgi:hypothetical protein